MGIKKATFTELLKSGYTHHTGFLSTKFTQQKNRAQYKPNQYSFVVSAKVAKLATVRNLLKRRGRAIIHKHKDEIVNNLICAFFFKAGVTKLKYKELEVEILAILNQANLIK